MRRSDGNYLDRGVVPLCVQLARILRTQINSGEYKPGDALPTEEGLSKAFGVSRITVREALRILTDENLIVRHSGKGTFVAKRSGLGASVWAACTIEDLSSTADMKHAESTWDAESFRLVKGFRRAFRSQPTHGC